MKIETKFNVGEKCYFLLQNELTQGEITEILIKVSLDERVFENKTIVYTVETKNTDIKLIGTSLFKSKKELAEHIVGQSTWEKIKNKLFK